MWFGSGWSRNEGDPVPAIQDVNIILGNNLAGIQLWADASKCSHVLLLLHGLCTISTLWRSTVNSGAVFFVVCFVQHRISPFHCQEYWHQYLYLLLHTFVESKLGHNIKHENIKCTNTCRLVSFSICKSVASVAAIYLDCCLSRFVFTTCWWCCTWCISLCFHTEQ